MPFSIRIGLFTSLLLSVSVLQADQLFIPGMQAQQVTYTDLQGNRLIFRTQRGDLSEREIERISHISVDGEPAFNDAELALIKDEKDKAIDGYTKTIRSTSKPWLKYFAARRLLTAIGDNPRFDARVVAYLALLERNPDEALAYKPELPPKGNRQLDVAITDVETMLKQPGLGIAQQVALYTFLLDLNRRKGDETGVISTLERLSKVADAAGSLPEIREQLAAARVTQAKLALEQGKYSEAVRLIQENRTSLNDPRLQSDALYILASAARSTADPSDKNALKDAALQFMRVVAHFSEIEGKPNVPASLIATAEIMEQLDQKEDAIQLYQQILNEFPNDPVARTADARLKQLSTQG